MKKKFLALVLTLAMVLSLLPATALATGDVTDQSQADAQVEQENEGTPSTNPDASETAVVLATGEAAIGQTIYNTVKEAVEAAQSGATIILGEGNYTLYGISSTGTTKGKDLTFIGQGAEKTGWNIGAKVPNPANFGTEYNGDYSFDGAGTVTFQNMTLRSGTVNYLGFIRADKTIVKDCIIDGKTFYWGYQSAMFKDCTFNCPNGDYALWTYSSPEMTFDRCTFNSSGKVINVYTDYDADKHDITVNFKNCTVNSTAWESLSVMNINDSNMGSFKYVINFSGVNTVNGIKADGIESTDGSHASTAYNTENKKKTSAQATCSKLFEFNMKYGNGNSGKTIVNMDTKPVWKDGRMISHAIDTANDKYTDGYKDNAFTYSYSDWTKNPDGTKTREVTKTCKYCGYQEKTTENAPADPIEWDVSRSKTATPLNTRDWTSDVTLSLPSAEKKLESDVVFVMDGSSSANQNVVKESLELLEGLKEAVEQSDAAVNVCVVKFKRQAFKSEWFDLSKNFDAIKTAMETKYSGGTNLHAGLLAGKEALEDHTNVSANRKYLILVSDGSTYLYSKDGNWASDTPFTRSYYTKENFVVHLNDGRTVAYAGGFNDQGLYNPSNGPEGYDPNNVARPTKTSDVVAWQAYLNDVKARNETVNREGKTGDDYDYHCEYKNNFELTPPIPSKDFKSQPCEPRTANNCDMAFYYADQTWQEMKEDGYHLFSIATEDGSAGAGNADDSHSFMNYLNDGASLKFSNIKNDIFYAVSTGSTVIDTIGEKFTFGGVDSFTLKVGTEKIEGVKDTSDENTVNFGDLKPDNSYPYTVTYTPDTKTFVWTINENVSNFAPVQLTYTVKLTTPETDPGTYGTEDLKGEKDVPADKALFTNESAVLNAINSAGAPVKEQAFPKPSVSYTVKNSHRPGGSGGGTITIPDDVPTGLNGKDHYAYVVGYPDGMVYPQKNITRAEVATIFFRLLEDETREANMTKSNGYNDMKDGAWYTCAVSTLSKMGIIKGYEDGSFKPDASISRAEFAAIAARFDPDGDKTPATFSDVSSHWAKDEISIAANHGWIKGYEDGSFKPDQKITRAETMTLVNRVLKRLPETKDDLHKDMKTWPDNQNESAWFYLAVQEATNSHYQNLKKDGTHEKWESMRETRDWAALEK